MKKRNHDANLIIGLILIALVFIPVLVGFFWLPYDPTAMDYDARKLAPSLAHLFGTDHFGRDLFSRVLVGARMTFMVGAASIAIGAIVGTLVGAFTGYFGGPVDEILMRFNDALASIPSVLLALVLVSLVGSSKYLVILTLGIVFIPSFARVARGEFLRGREADYVKNAKLMGAGPLRIMFRHILPNTGAIMLSSLTVGFNNAVLAEAGLSYLGIGAQPSDISLGRMLAEAQGYIYSIPWYAVFPGLVIVITVLGFSLVNEAISAGGNSTATVSKRKIDKLIAKENVKRKQEEEVDNRRGALKNKVTHNEYTEAAPDKSLALRQNTVKNGDEALLRVSNLSVGFYEHGKWDYVVKNSSFSVNKGEIVGIVGESGSGKSMTALALMGLLKKNGYVTEGKILFDGDELTEYTAAQYRNIRGMKLSMVFQEPMTSLNPLVKIGKQVEELLEIHGLPGSGAIGTKEINREVVYSVMGECGLKDPEELYDQYPHQLSGGMRQRVMLAMAMICSPKLLIADEPTTALDVTTQAKILRLIQKMNENYGTAVIFISHDLKLIQKLCHRVVVMYKGDIVEKGTVAEVFENPRAAYTAQLIHAAMGDIRGKADGGIPADAPHVLETRDLNVYYKVKSGKLFAGNRKKQVVNNANIYIKQGEILGLVGESGCGKSSLAKAIAGLQKYKKGTIELMEKGPQMVFQDPYDSLNPAKKIGWLLQEPLRLNTKMNKKQRQAEVDAILKKVELPLKYKERYPHELSGGERQRVAIALALILKRKFIILDEPVSALDVTVQEQILELLIKLRNEEGLSYLFISHDMQVVRRICDYVCVMHKGDIVEHGKTEDIFNFPKDEYTKKLIKASEY